MFLDDHFNKLAYATLGFPNFFANLVVQVQQDLADQALGLYVYRSFV